MLTPTGAVDFLRTRVAALRALAMIVCSLRLGGGSCRTVKERCLDCAAALLVDAETRRRRPRPLHCDHRRGELSVSGSDGQSASEESGAELGMRDDTRVVARKHPGSLTVSTIVSFARQVGYAQATESF